MIPFGQVVTLDGDLNDTESPLTVETQGNHIYFYSHVNSDRCLDLIKQLRTLDEKLRNEKLSRDVPEENDYAPIWLHIQSGGGSLFAGWAACDQLEQIKTPVYSIVEGYAASAATLISMSCTRRYIQPRAMMMIHQLSAAAWGTYQEIQDWNKMLDVSMEQLVNFYVTKSNLSEERVRDALKHDSWFSSQECLDVGLADEFKE